MAIKPILFNTEMVRAILDGRKSCTRRLVKPQPDEKHTYPLGFVTDSTEKKEVGCFGFGIDEYGGSIQYAKPPYQPGDILYVRETFYEDVDCILYKADNEKLTGYRNMRGEDIVVKWRPSIHMPKEAARIWLRVTDVRVERLHEITEDGAKAEGINEEWARSWWHPTYDDPDSGGYPRYRDTFALDLWNSTIKKSALDKYGWDANPWVWVIEFERCEKPAESPYAWNDAIHKLTKGV